MKILSRQLASLVIRTTKICNLFMNKYPANTYSSSALAKTKIIGKYDTDIMFPEQSFIIVGYVLVPKVWTKNLIRNLTIDSKSITCFEWSVM